MAGNFGHSIAGPGSWYAHPTIIRLQKPAGFGHERGSAFAQALSLGHQPMFPRKISQGDRETTGRSLPGGLLQIAPSLSSVCPKAQVQIKGKLSLLDATVIAPVFPPSSHAADITIAPGKSV